MFQKDQRKSRDGGRKSDQEYDQKIIDLARVTRVMAGGKRLRFRACVAIGDKKGKVGMGFAKGADVTMAVTKAVNKAKKELVTVPIVNETIPHEIRFKLGAAKIMLKPAPKGTGIKAGGAVRVVLELAGVPNVVGKIMGTNNKINNVKALLAAIGLFKPAAIRGNKKRFIKVDKDNESQRASKDEVENIKAVNKEK